MFTDPGAAELAAWLYSVATSDGARIIAFLIGWLSGVGTGAAVSLTVLK